jgi:hypothetical protein
MKVAGRGITFFVLLITLDIQVTSQGLQATFQKSGDF